MDKLPSEMINNNERNKFDSLRHKIRIMQSFIDGKEILSKNRVTKEVTLESNPKWNWDEYSYMIPNPNYQCKPHMFKKTYPDDIIVDSSHELYKQTQNNILNKLRLFFIFWR